MGYYAPTRTDLSVVRQTDRSPHIKIELLNSDFKIIDILEGELLDDNLNINAESSVRRTYSFSLYVKNSSFLVGYDKKIWLDKYIRPYVGIKELRSGEIAYYLQGTFVMLSTSYRFDETSKTLTIECSDMMSTLNGERDGILSGLEFTIPSESSARNVIIDLLAQAGITKYLIQDMNYVIPYDLEFDAGTTYYYIFNEIVNLYGNLEMFFDVNGTFTIQKIPTCVSDAVVIDDSIMEYVVISEDIDIPFTDIYNRVEVWGQQIEVDYSTSSSTYSSNVYNATISGITNLKRGEVYGVMINNTNSLNCKLNINGYGALLITNDDGTPISANTLQNGINAFRYRLINGAYNFYWLGQYQVYGEANEDNIKSPFHRENYGRIVSKVCQSGEFDAIYSNSLAIDRARLELFRACRLNDKLNLTMLAIPWLDVNWKIEYTSYTTKETKQYIIKNVSGSLSSGTYQVSLIGFYDDDPFL